MSADIDVDLDRDLARSETHAVAFHRYTDPDGHPSRSPDDIVDRILDGPRG